VGRTFVSRILFYDKIRSSSAYVEHGEIEFASILCANTAEFPLKLGWFEVSEKFLRDAINRRENQRVTSIKIILPLLRLKAKRLVKDSERLEVPEIMTILINCLKTCMCIKEFQMKKEATSTF